MSEPTHDVIVIGGGPVGENAAQYAIAGSDRTAAIVEAELVGGECSYWACMPSKALLLPGQVRRRAAAMPGVEVGERLDVDAVLARRDSFTSGWDDAGQVEWAEGAGIEVVRGRGRLAGERRVVVGDRTLVARHAVVIATGSVPVVPGVPGLAEAKPWGSRDATALHEVPDSVAVIGGGVVGCEAASWLASFGCRATMLVRGDRLLGAVEEFASDAVLAGLREQGVDVRLDCGPDRVARAEVHDEPRTGHRHGGPVTLSVGGEEVVVDEVLVATGRRPAADDLGLDTVGLDAVEVDDRMRVAGVDGDWLYACGDVAGRAPLTHMGKYEGRVVGDVIAAVAEGRSTDEARHRARADHDAVTQVVFTDPEVAAVGPTEQQARDEGLPVRGVEVDIAVAGSSLSRDDFSGHAELVIDTERRVVVGATFVGTDIAELLHAATIAVVGQVPLDVLWHAVPAYPTVSEVWLRLLEAERSG